MALPLVRLVGSPYTQGALHGRALRHQIAHNLQVYFHRFERETKLSRPEVLRRASQYAERIADQNPAYYVGMRGIADGSGFGFAEIAALNVRYELFYYQFGVNAMVSHPDGCTAYAIHPDHHESGHLVMGENWDWIVGVKGAVLHTTDEEGFRTLAFSEAGIFGGKIGLNSAGLGLAINGLTSDDDDWARLERPFHVRCYEILRARSFGEALAVVGDETRSCSTNFLIGSAPDQIANLEAAPKGINRLGCEDGCVVHANHFVAPEVLGISEPPIEKNPHSYRRHDRLGNLLRSGTKVSMASLQAALRDHADHPYSVCHHPDPEEVPEERYETLTSAIMDLQGGDLYLTDGPPCQAPYVHFRV